jgi:hypothetical protein
MVNDYLCGFQISSASFKYTTLGQKQTSCVKLKIDKKTVLR